MTGNRIILAMLVGIFGCSAATTVEGWSARASRDAEVYAAVFRHFAEELEILRMDPRPIDLREVALPTEESYLPGMDRVIEQRRRALESLGAFEGEAFSIPHECTALMMPPGRKRSSGCLPAHTNIVVMGLPVFDTADSASVRVAQVRYHVTGFEVAVYDAAIERSATGWTVSRKEVLWYYE